MNLLQFFKPSCSSECNHKKDCEKLECVPSIAGVLAILRNLLGPRNVCIFLVNCPDYARYHWIHSNFFKAILLITMRLLLCNPIVGLARRLLIKE